MLKKKTAAKVDEAVAKSVNFEITVADLARRSERRAWWVAFSAIGMSLILAGGYFYMLPLKEKVPFVVMADAYTGTSTVARLNDDFLNKRITTSEAINRSNVAHFVLARESYDSAMINLRDWTTVLTMSSTGVASAYTSLYAPRNDASPYKVYGRTRAIRVKILSIVLLGGGPNSPPKGATVRFQRSLYDKQTGATMPMDSKIATLSFAYKTNLRMDEQYRIENPLGFQVTEYRVDSDYATTPPEEVPAVRDDAGMNQQGNSMPASGSGPGEALQRGAVPPPPAMPENHQGRAMPQQTPAATPWSSPNGARE
ncbi:virB8 family protein [Dyella jiangningensis]|uniref:Conjugative transfer protein n=1 Tax=Dyella jiangningensis TaxID=1379159 RepID=A0A328P0Q0_9GAMM|nr:type IV secretion system protein [Dyella jiangningensis]RAO75760.1 conjugative transfer protein [Dyella jiangningensis]